MAKTSSAKATDDRKVLSQIISELQILDTLAYNLFNWHNLPPGLTSRYIENLLFEYGSISFFNTNAGLLCARYHISSWNIYGDPLTVEPVWTYPISGQMVTLPESLDNFARVCWDNSGRKRLSIVYREKIKLMAEIRQSIYIMQKQLRSPRIVVFEEEHKESFARLMAKIEEGYAWIPIKSGLAGQLKQDAVFTLDLGRSHEALYTLWDTYYKVQNEIYTLFGLTHSGNQGKRAQLTIQEVLIENAATMAIYEDRHRQRQVFCESINKEFGTDIQVEMTYSKQWQLESFALSANAANNSELVRQMVVPGRNEDWNNQYPQPGG